MAFTSGVGSVLGQSVRPIIWIGLVCLLAAALLSACDDGSLPAPTDLPTNTPAPGEIPTQPPSDTPAATPVPKVTPEPTATLPVPTPEPTPTQASTATPTPEPTPTQAPTATPTPEPTPTQAPTATPTPEPTPTQAPMATPTPEPSPVEIGTTVEAGGSSYTLNEVKDPAPAGVFGVDAGKRLVALDITQVGISDDGDPYNPLYFAVQDTDGYVYVPGFADADVEPSFGSGELAAGQIVRGWVVFELPESARLVSVLADPEVFGAKVTITDLAQDQGGNIVSHNPPPVPSPPSSPVEIGTTVEAGGSSYTLNEVKDPAPAGVFGVDAGKRLVALDITQVGISDDGDPYNPLYFAVQDTDGYVYVPGFADADVEPSFGSGELAAGQIVRGWVVFELPESARLVSVLADPEVFGAKITIADLGTVSVVGPAQATTQLSIIVSIVPGELPQYDRDDWRHWIDADDDCQDTRHEVLIGESQAAVTYKSDRQCKVEAGQWFGAFTATTVTEASKLDIDHLVPLANAHRSGGWAWAAKRKQHYANSLDNPDHLIAVTASANRSKGAKGPDEWRPPNESYWCDYAVSWIGVKQTWELTVTPAEAGALQDMLETCASPPHLTITETDSASGPANPTPTPMAGDTYASCDEADEAGEQRVQGSKGPGRGFPQSKVPSARDGDGDGVVCEK